MRVKDRSISSDRKSFGKVRRRSRREGGYDAQLARPGEITGIRLALLVLNSAA